jgi:hypothetical protein
MSGNVHIPETATTRTTRTTRRSRFVRTTVAECHGRAVLFGTIEHIVRLPPVSVHAQGERRVHAADGARPSAETIEENRSGTVVGAADD